MKFWSLTDQGKVRKQNQDVCEVRSFRTEDGIKVIAAVVCDGMGGAKAGNVASALGMDVFLRELQSGFITEEDKDAQVLHAVRAANRAIYEQAKSNEEYEGMGTTLVAAICIGSSVTIANVGDSRCYLVSGDTITQLTKDHSLVEDMIDRGELDRAEAWKHPRRNFITRALGAEPDVKCDLFFHTMTDGDKLLLCSDGLSGIVSQQELLFEIVYGGELDTAVQRMVDISLERGAPDNVTAVLLCAERAEAE